MQALISIYLTINASLPTWKPVWFSPLVGDVFETRVDIDLALATHKLDFMMVSVLSYRDCSYGIYAGSVGLFFAHCSQCYLVSELNINQIDKKALGYRYGRTGTD